MSIPPEDRGFTLGDGLFETVLARRGELAAWDAHMGRLARGCQALGLPPPGPDHCRAAAAEALAAHDLTGVRAAVRLSWTAGSGGRGLDRPEAPVPRLVVQAAAAPRLSGPLSLAVVSVRRNAGSPASRLKTLSYLDQVLARREAQAAGADEALMLNGEGEVACCAVANLFWLHGAALFTPALACGVLDGTMRGAVVGRARAQGWTVQEARAGLDALDAADALFVTNSLIGVRAVGRLDGRVFAPHPGIDALAALVDDLI